MVFINYKKKETILKNPSQAMPQVTAPISNSI